MIKGRAMETRRRGHSHGFEHLRATVALPCAPLYLDLLVEVCIHLVSLVVEDPTGPPGRVNTELWRWIHSNWTHLPIWKCSPPRSFSRNLFCAGALGLWIWKRRLSMIKARRARQVFPKSGNGGETGQETSSLWAGFRLFWASGIVVFPACFPDVSGT